MDRGPACLHLGKPNRIMTIHPDAITDDQKRVLQTLGPVATDHDFYLAGGTAVALQLGHRRSVDLDWFTETSLSDPMQWAQKLREAGIAFTTSSVDEGTLHGSVHDVRVSFLEYRYALLQPPISWDDYETEFAALDDLACMKLVAIAQRGAKKDFIDLYALIREHRPLPVLIERYRQKYSPDDIAHLLYALVYFDEADEERTPVLLWDVQWPTIKQALRDATREMTQ